MEHSTPQIYTEFLPISRADMEARGWEQLDFVVVGGDAYVDHPSFGTAIISRLLEAEGYKIGVLAQPRYTDCEDFKRFGKPKYGFFIGGGNVAMDVCRSAVRLGADETYVLYRRSEAELPADPEEVKEAMEEGVQFRFLTAPVEILGADGKVTGIRVERMTLGEPDEKGRRKPVGTGEFETIAVDSVIGAIGQTVDWGSLDTGALVTTKKGTAEADALTYQTAQPDIFVGGDCYTGPKFAIDAIAAGKEAAISLHRYVHPGQTLTAGRDRRVYKALDKDHVLIETAGFDKDHRQTPGYNAAKAKTFSDARVTFTE